MSKEVSTDRIARKSSEEQKPIEPWSMDAAADRLMDEVFSDVNRIVETGSEPPVETPETEYVSLKQITYPSISLSPGILPHPSEADTKNADKDAKPHDEGKSLNKLLLGAACASLAITLLLWLAGQGRLNRLFGITATSPAPETPKIASQDDSQFIDYVQRSLDVIGQKPEEKDNKRVASLPSLPLPPAPNELVPVPVPGNLPQNRPQSVLERVYIPVYPRPQPVYINPATPKVAAAPRPAAQPSPNVTAAARPNPTVTTITPPAVKPFPNITAAARPTATAAPSAAATTRPTAKPSPAVSPSAAATTRPTAKPSPTVAAVSRPPAAPSPQRAPATASPTAAAVAPPAPQPTFRPQPTTQASASTPAIRYTLVGVLVLGEKSAAIFEVGGASRRIHVGESIGSTGWTLVEVGNDEAVVRRNGEVRSIYVGQQF